MDTYDLLKEGDQWKLKERGAEKAIKNFKTKEEGKKFSIDFLKKHSGSLRIRKENGQIQEERTYPRKIDPRKSKG